MGVSSTKTGQNGKRKSVVPQISTPGVVEAGLTTDRGPVADGDGTLLSPECGAQELHDRDGDELHAGRDVHGDGSGAAAGMLGESNAIS
jgi:hypothetical protein